MTRGTDGNAVSYGRMPIRFCFDKSIDLPAEIINGDGGGTMDALVERLEILSRARTRHLNDKADAHMRAILSIEEQLQKEYPLLFCRRSMYKLMDVLLVELMRRRHPRSNSCRKLSAIRIVVESMSTKPFSKKEYLSNRSSIRRAMDKDASDAIKRGEDLVRPKLETEADGIGFKKRLATTNDRGLLQTVQDLLWRMEYMDVLRYNEAVLQEPRCILALWIRGKDAFVMIPGVEPANSIRLVTITVDGARKFLTLSAQEDDRYRTSFFPVIRKYDIKQEVLEMECRKLCKLSETKWCAMDHVGGLAYLCRDDLGLLFDGMPTELQEDLLKRTESKFLEAGGNGKKWIFIPAGKRMATEVGVTDVGSSPVWTFPLQFVNREGDYDCLAKALAAALWYQGEHEAAKRVIDESAAIARELLEEELPIRFLTLARNVIRRITGRRLRILPKKRMYRPLYPRLVGGSKETASQAIFLGKLAGRSNEVLHVVAFVGDVMFDPNFGYAVKTSQASLEVACGGYGYKGLSWACHID